MTQSTTIKSFEFQPYTIRVLDTLKGNAIAFLIIFGCAFTLQPLLSAAIYHGMMVFGLESLVAMGFTNFLLYIPGAYCLILAFAVVVFIVVADISDRQAGYLDGFKLLKGISITLLIYTFLQEFVVLAVTWFFHFPFLLIVFGFLFLLTVPAIVIERLGIITALERSAQMTKGNRIKFLVIIVVVYGLFMTANKLIVFMLGHPWSDILRTSFVDFTPVLVLSIVSAISVTLLATAYHDLRQART